jgi:Spy/CpxP family protein refolding chaperone
MHTTLKTAIAAAATVLSLAAAAAPGPRAFNAGDVDQRQARQSERIERGFARGDIDRQQLRSLRHTQREIARADGRISRFELRQLTAMLDRVDEQIRQTRRHG